MYKYLNKKISQEKREEVTKASRLMLQADYLEFEFLDIIYKFTSLRFSPTLLHLQMLLSKE